MLRGRRVRSVRRRVVDRRTVTGGPDARVARNLQGVIDDDPPFLLVDIQVLYRRAGVTPAVQISVPAGIASSSSQRTLPSAYALTFVFSLIST